MEPSQINSFTSQVCERTASNPQNRAEDFAHRGPLDQMELDQMELDLAVPWSRSAPKPAKFTAIALRWFALPRRFEMRQGFAP